MRASLMDSFGGPEVLRITEVADPVARFGEVVVRVAATSVNPVDLKYRSGAVKPGESAHFPLILGLDLAGTVVALGEGVSSLAVGDQVFGMAKQTYATLCVAAAATLAKLPEGMNLIEAAALPVVTTTGNLLGIATGAKEAQSVLVTGAVGNVGRSAVYTLKQRGAHVTAAVLKAQLTEAASIGADQIVATDDPEALALLPSLDAVADTVGGQLANDLLANLKPGGVYASVLGPPGDAEKYPGVHIESVVASPNPEILLTMASAVQRGLLTIPVARQLPLAEAAEGHRQAADRTVHGKVLLVADPGDPARSQAEGEIKALLATYNAALNESDTEAVLPLYTTDGIFMAPYSPSAIGQDAIRTAYDQVFQHLKFDVVFTVLELVVLTPVYAYARTGSAGHTTNPQTGKPSSEGNQELFVFRKEADGRWKIARYSFSPVSPPKA